MTRRALLPCTAMAARLAKATPHARVKSLLVIRQQPEFYHGWPTLTRLHSGELLVTYSGGREAHCERVLWEFLGEVLYESELPRITGNDHCCNDLRHVLPGFRW